MSELPASTAVSPAVLEPVRRRAIILALLVAVFGLYFGVKSMVLGAPWIELPWVTLFALVALQPLLSRFLRMTKKDTIVIFIFLLVAANCMDSVNRFLPTLTTLRYYALPDNNYQLLEETYIPRWFAPQDPEVHRIYWEGSYLQTASIRPWLWPIARWIGFFMAMWAVMFAIVSLLRRHWVENERLAFPLVTVPLYIAATGHGRMQPRKTIWHEPLMWVGFSVSFLHFLSIMLHALNPSIPTLSRFTDIGRLFTEKPWTAVQPLWFVYNPLYTGLGYFAPQDLCFSMWFFFLAYIEPLKIFYTATGIPMRSWLPYTWEQTAGSFFALAALFAWAGRGYLRRLWQAIVADEPIARPGDPHPWADPLRPRKAFVIALVGFVFLCGWYMAAGMTWWVALAFFAMIFLFAIIFTRGRAETGVFAYYLVPFFQASSQLKSWLGQEALTPRGSYANLTLLSSLLWLHFGFFPENMTFQIEGLRMAEEARIKTSHISWTIIGAMLVGLVVVFYAFLSTYAEYGALTVGPEGGWWAGEVRAQYNEVSGVVNGVTIQRDWARNGYTLWAAILTLILAAVRYHYPSSPFNPLGFGLTVHYGVILWGPFLVTWFLKRMILRFGGGRLYHQLAPIFVGLVIGQLFAINVVWNIFAQFTPEAWKSAASPIQG